MRIYLTTDSVGGVWDYTASLARGLTDAGHDVRLAVIGGVDPDRLAALPESAEIATADFRLEWMPDAAQDVPAAADWLVGDARAWGADVVHLNQMSYAVRDFGAPTVVVVHSDVLSWFSETLGTPAPPEWEHYADAVRAGLHVADLVVAPSTYQSDLTRSHYGRGADRVVHNAVRPPDAETPAADRPLIVSVGRAWDRAKGMAVLDAAAGMVVRSGVEVHMLGPTTGPDGQSFTARNVVCHGRATRREVDAWLSRASLYVGASLYEPFGLAPLEAAFRGTALVLSDIPSFRELWDGVAVFVARGDAVALASTLRELAPDLALCEELGEAARDRALSRFTADRFTAEYLDLYTAHQPCA